MVVKFFVCLFVYVTEEQIQKHSILCEEAIRKNQPQKMVDNTASIARYCSHTHAHAHMHMNERMSTHTHEQGFDMAECADELSSVLFMTANKKPNENIQCLSSGRNLGK